MELNKNKHLNDALESHKMSHIRDFSNKVLERKSEIIQKLANHYATSQRYDAFTSGSMAKHTAINIKFDCDVVQPFKRKAFETLSEMFDDIFSFLEEEYGDVATVRKQKVSVGIKFPQEENDRNPICIDVVPGRELSEEDFLTTKALNLYYNEDVWGFKKGSYQKTNISAQIEHIKEKEQERQIIRLFKIWKNHLNKDYKSFLIELICIEAFKGYSGSTSLWDRLKFAMEYIRDHITDESFHLYDPGNSGNDLMASMEYYKKSALKTEMESMLNNIDQNAATYLPYYFPINDEFDPNNDDGYKRKGSSETVSYPRSPQRFG